MNAGGKRRRVGVGIEARDSPSLPVISPQDDGSFITNTDYFQNGKPLSGAPVFRYREASDAELFIKSREG